MNLHPITPDSPLTTHMLKSASGNTVVKKFSKGNETHVFISFTQDETIEREYIQPDSPSIITDMIWKFITGYLENTEESPQALQDLPDCSRWYENVEATNLLETLYSKACASDEQRFLDYAKQNPALWNMKNMLQLDLKMLSLK